MGLKKCNRLFKLNGKLKPSRRQLEQWFFKRELHYGARLKRYIFQRGIRLHLGEGASNRILHYLAKCANVAERRYSKGLRYELHRLGKKKKPGRFPMEWMKKDIGLWNRLDRTPIIQVLNYIDSHGLSLQKAQELSAKRKIGFYETVIKSGQSTGEIAEYVHALFVPNYEHMAQVLRLSVASVKKYLRGLAGILILNAIGKDGPRGPSIFTYGYWIPGGGVKFFLRNDKRYKYALLNFRVRQK